MEFTMEPDLNNVPFSIRTSRKYFNRHQMDIPHYRRTFCCGCGWVFEIKQRHPSGACISNHQSVASSSALPLTETIHLALHSDEDTVLTVFDIMYEIVYDAWKSLSVESVDYKESPATSIFPYVYFNEQGAIQKSSVNSIVD